MEFRLLGPVEIWAAGARVAAGEPRQRAVLAALLVDAGHTVGTDTLVERVWGEDAPAQARRTLQSHLARIRRLLAGGPALVRRAGGYSLEVDPDRVDALRFRSLLTSARSSERTAAEQASELREALSLWRGIALSGVDGLWAQRVRAAWEHDRLEAAVAWGRAEASIGNAAASLGPLAELAAANPLAESLVATLMRSFYAAGRPADALEQFARIRARLREQFGSDPGPELRALHQAILRDELVVALETTGRTRAPAQLPADVAGFTGRSAELAELDRLVDPAGDRDEPTAAVIVAITGTAGVGKTALAVRWAHRVTDRFPDGQLYVDLRGYDPDQPVAPADALAGFLSALAPGDPVPAELDARSARYRSAVAGRRMLVVLDNAATVEQVRPLLVGTPTAIVVVTSRDSLAGLVAVHGARRVPLDLLPDPDAIVLLRLLIGSRVDAEPDAAAALVAQCARLPLALRVAAELAIARPAESLATLVSELDDHRRRLDLLAAGGDPRGGVRSVFASSVARLPPDAAMLFRLLGGQPAADADRFVSAALTGWSIDRAQSTVDVLLRAHLVYPVGRDRYGLHDLLKAYARDLSRADESARAAQGRLLDYYLAAASAAMDGLHPARAHHRPVVPDPATPLPPLGDPAAARQWLVAEQQNLVAINSFAAAHGWPSHAARLSAVLYRFLLGEQNADAMAVHGHARDAARRAGDEIGEAHALLGLGTAEWQAARLDRAAECFESARVLFRRAGDTIGEARATGNLGQATSRLGRLTESQRLYERAMALFRENRDANGVALARSGIGTVHSRLGDRAAAATEHEQALALFRCRGDDQGRAWALTNLGEAYRGLGRLAEAVDLHRRSVKLFIRVGDRAAQAWALTGLGCAQTDLGDADAATMAHAQALQTFREVGERDGEPAALNGLGEAARVGGLPVESTGYHEQALALATEAGDTYEMARAHVGLASEASHARAARDLCDRLGLLAAHEFRT